MRLELGALSLVLEKGDDVDAVFRSLFRHLNNMELADMFGVSAKTVARWQQEERLPRGRGKGLMMLELFKSLGGEGPTVQRGHKIKDPGNPGSGTKFVAGGVRGKSAGWPDVSQNWGKDYSSPSSSSSTSVVPASSNLSRV